MIRYVKIQKLYIIIFLKIKGNLMFLLPLILIELYLICSLLIFAFGPILWELESALKFWFLMISYHFAFIIGYLLYVKKNKTEDLDVDKIYDNNRFENFILKYFWIYLFIAFIGTLISYKNSYNPNNYIPYSLFIDFYNGIISPGTGRHEFISSLGTYQSNKNLTIFYSSIAFIKYSLIPILVYLWHRLSLIQRTIGLFISLIPFMGTVSIGTNKLVLDTLIMFSLALFIYLLSIKKGKRITELNKRKTIVVLIIFLALFFPYYFNKSMSERSTSFQYMETIGKKNTINISYYDNPEAYVLSHQVMEFYIKISTYLTQGYYGMSLALDEEFDTTYGIGHSYFLLDQFKYFFNIDLIQKTYQYKIHEDWDRLVQWHSFYSQVANDVSFYGVIPVMFVLGYLLSAIYISAIKNNNIIAKAILTLFAVMFVYMPANNQIFNFMESMFSFWTLLLLWFYTNMRRKIING